MTSMRKALAAGAATLAVALAGSAQAATYLLTLDGCTGGCGTAPFGKVVTSQEGTGTVDVTVTLFNGAIFHDTNDPQHHALVFDLTGSPTVTISDLGSPFTADGTQAAGSNSASPFGDFEYVINFPHEKKPPAISTFSFDVSAASLTPASFTFTYSDFGHVLFATDIIGANGNTGNVGALAGAVPEPASWAMMLIGFLGLGALLRRRRGSSLAAV
ncbi:MAG: PEPxxWA-CTERM sorting domain-containing protein [Caulobacteraceae bacterium]